MRGYELERAAAARDPTTPTMSAEREDHEQLAEQLEHEADQLQEHEERLHQRAEDVRQDWERKRRDESVPGANPPDSENPAPEPGAAEVEGPSEQDV